MTVNAKLKVENKKMQSQIFICSNCNKCLRSKPALLKHLKKCIKTEPTEYTESKSKFTCNECQRVFSRKAYLQNHINRIHLNKSSQIFTCFLCEKNLHSKVTLAKHLQKCGTNKPKKEATDGFPRQKGRRGRLKLASAEPGVKKKHVCVHCEKVFTRNSYLECHVRHVHLNEPAPVFCCDRCKKNFSRKFTLLRHLQQCSVRDPNEANNQNNLKCALCEYKDCRSELTEHYKKEHGVDISLESWKFENFQTFMDWKNKIEKQTVAKFVRRNFCKSAKATTYYYRCHRDGFFKTESKNKRHIKMLGSNKINGFCPAKMDVTVTKGKDVVHVKFLKSHVGHQMELRRIPLSQSEREKVASKLAMKLPLDEVLNTIRENMDENNVERVHLVTKSDLFNIRRMYKLNDPSKQKQDTINLEVWLEETKESPQDPLVRFYKPQGERNQNYYELDENDFLLVIMNNIQLETLRKYGSSFVCIDNVHGSSESDFHLTTLMVLDDSRQGFPCLFIFSNKSNHSIFKVVFSVLKEILGAPLQPSVFMSDMADYYYNAWYEIMGPVYFRLFCTWHVIKAWKESISSKIKNCEKQENMRKVLRSLLEEDDVFSFEKTLESTLCSMENDQDLINFKTYFVQNFISNRNFWAYGYRKDASLTANNVGVDTNLHLQGMHQTFRHIYLRGKNIKRIVKTINSVMNLVKHKIHDKVTEPHKGKLSMKSAEIRRRHKIMQKLKSCSVISDIPGKSWLVRSSAGKEMYKIELSHPDCKCDLKCVDCDICIHAYICSCPDSSVKWNMCKHIHMLVQQSHMQTSVQETVSNSSDDYNIEDLCFFNDPPKEQEKPRLPTPPPEPQINPQSNPPPPPAQIYYNMPHETMNNHQNIIDFKAKVEQNNHQALMEFKAKIEQNFLELMRNVTTIEQCRVLDNAILSLKPTIQPPAEVTGNGFTFFHL